MEKIKKIIIFGFPHCGTSILRSIIGHSDDIYEVMSEVQSVKEVHLDIAHKLGKKYVLIKWPFYTDYKSKMYEDYIKIFIIRNPYYVFSSLNRRFEWDIPQCHSLKRYMGVLQVFLDVEEKGYPKLYCIRYENMFKDNYKLLRDTFDEIGFSYDESLFDNTRYTNHILKKISANIKDMPQDKDHGRFRTWQINQPFKNMNDKNKLELTKDQVITLNNSETIVKAGYKIV